MKKSFIKLAFAPSLDQAREIKNEAPAFAARVLSDKAKKDRAWCSSCRTGYSFLSTALAGSSLIVCCLDDYSTKSCNNADYLPAASCVAFFHIYDPELNFIKSAKKVEYTAPVWMPNDPKADKFEWLEDAWDMKNVTSTGYVATFGNLQYYLHGFEEAKAAYEKDGTMLPILCCEVGSSENTVPFSRENRNDLMEADELFEQYLRMLTEGASEEDMRGVIPTEFVCEMVDGTPIYTPFPALILWKIRSITTLTKLKKTGKIYNFAR